MSDEPIAVFKLDVGENTSTLRLVEIDFAAATFKFEKEGPLGKTETLESYGFEEFATMYERNDRLYRVVP